VYLKEERLTKGTYHKEDNSTLRVLSLGAGVQSTTLLMMMMYGEVKPADVCIFADTGNEPEDVYKHLRYLQKISSIPIHVVNNGHIIDDLEKSGFIKIPAYTKNENGVVVIGRRQCTNEYKIKPIHREIRKILGRQRLRYTSIEIVMGISIDEVQRMAYPKNDWAIHCYPLVANEISRSDCLEYMKAHKMPTPPRSSCIICPYRSEADWLTMKIHKYSEFKKAVEFDEHLREYSDKKNYLSRHAIPLKEVQFGKSQSNEVLDVECEGYCGY